MSMSGSAKLDVHYVAQLARIELSPEEAELFGKQLGDVLQYVAKLETADVRGVDATAHALPVANVMREDEPRDYFTAEQALANAPRQRDHLFIVPKVVE
jgi:aspartyl-tRNA(Asn)/glutamyl-tRNA(Gln) amidotransferase subunit C